MSAETREPEHTSSFVPIGDRFVAKRMVVPVTPPAQIMRLIICDSGPWRRTSRTGSAAPSKATGTGSPLTCPGDLLHSAVVQDRIALEENPRGFVSEVFDAADNSVRTTRFSGRGVPVTVADRARKLALVLLVLVEW